MRGFVAIAVAALCAAVAYAEYVPYPNSILEAWSDLNMPIGHFYVELQVPPEPKDQSNQKVVYFVSANMNYMFHGHATVRAGLVLMWDVENHWRAIAGGKSCDSTGSNCRLSWADDAALAAEPGDIVFLNVSNVPSKGIAGYEVSLPFKAQTTGFRMSYPIEQDRFIGMLVTVNAASVSWANHFPVGTTNLLKMMYTTAANSTTEIPLDWRFNGQNKWGQQFVQKGNILSMNWQ